MTTDEADILRQRQKFIATLASDLGGESAAGMVFDALTFFFEVVSTFKEPLREDSSPQAKRARYVRVLLALTRFAQAMDQARFNPPLMSAEISWLAAGLSDLDYGTVHDFLAPARECHRPKDSTVALTGRAYVAIALELLRPTAGAYSSAAAQAARAFPALSHLRRAQGADLSGAILQWHRQFKGGTVKDLYAAKLFDGLLDGERRFILEHSPQDAAERAHRYLGAAAAQAPLIKWGG